MFTPLPPALARIHRELKARFDPDRLFNPGRLVPRPVMTAHDAPATEESMRQYYAQRAQVYERVYHKPERQRDLRAMEAALAVPFAGRHVLEVACGTGWWTPHGARLAASWLATDLNPETLAIAQAKAMPASVRFAAVDAYTLAGLEGQTFDAAFAGFWWSHVPLARLRDWLSLLHSRLERGAQVVLLDNRFVAGSSTTDLAARCRRQHLSAAHARRRQRARGGEELSRPRRRPGRASAMACATSCGASTRTTGC